MPLFAKGLIFAGLALIVMGIAISFLPKIPFLGKLPGDICIKGEHSSFYFPLMTCILISVIVSFMIWWIRQR